MRRDKYEDEWGSSNSGNGSSWISYSDMMASLLLVFVLMLSVSLLQYFTMPKQEDLDRQASIEEQIKEIEKREAALKEKEESLNEREAKLTERENAVTAKEAELKVLESALKAMQEQLEKDQAELKAAQDQLAKDQAELKAAQDQLANDQAELKAAQDQLKKDQEQLEKDRAELDAERKQLDEDLAAMTIEKEQLQKELEELKAAQEQLVKDQSELKAAQEQLKKEKQEVETLRDELEKRLKEIGTPTPTPTPTPAPTATATPTPIPTATPKPTSSPEPTPTPTPEGTPTVDPVEIERQLAELRTLQEQQEALENYTVKSKIINDQFSAFNSAGLMVSIDPDTGEIILANSILFDVGSDVIRQEGKEFLNEFIPVYLDVLMNPEYEGYISEVIIEGHTDTNGSYFGNLNLSQSRATNVMEYSLNIPNLTMEQKDYLQTMVSATGRGSADPVYDINGEIDLEACRRVEFKFRMKDPGILAGTGIIEELTQVLEESGLEVSVDENTGDICLNSTIMFDTNSAEVKEAGRKFIRKFLPVYLDVLMKPEYQEYIGVIIIEGYTDNKGTYVANLELSQQRASNVMRYCLEIDLSDEQKEYLRQKITATGRSCANLIYKANGRVDLNASRRVEFKFRLKDTKSLDELKKMLQETSQGSGK